jgi:hypothetical protein
MKTRIAILTAVVIAYLGTLGAAGLMVARSIHAFSGDSQRASAIAASEIRARVAAATSVLGDEKPAVPDAAKPARATGASSAATANPSADAGDGATAKQGREVAARVPQQAASPATDATRVAGETAKAAPTAQTPVAATPPASAAPSSNLDRSAMTAPTVTATREAAAAAADFVSAGDKRLQDGDVATARLYYAKAAELGDGAGALRLGNSFDPGFLAAAGVRGMTGDRAEAERWYRQAVALGNPMAARALAALGRE